MMATDYLDKYIESVSDLPAQLQRKFRLIRDLDEKSAKLQVGLLVLVLAIAVRAFASNREVESAHVVADSNYTTP